MPTVLVRREKDHVTGIVEEFWYDTVEDRVTIKRVSDVQKITDMNKEMHGHHNRPNYRDSNGQHLVARIPLIVVDMWREQGFDWFKSTDKERRAWLDKPENEVFKTRPGKLNSVTKTRLTTKAS